jgi:4-hydroxybenzoate polyprenyltransferase
VIAPGAVARAGARSGLVRELLLASRPLSWIDTALPFLAAALSVQRSLDPLVLLGTLYFLVPYNLLLYGVNDIFDYESDLANPRKRSLEGGLVPPDRRRAMWLAIAVTNLPLLAAIAVLAPPPATAAVVLAAVAALIYSMPPLRTKERPFADSLTSASHFVLPAVAGFLMAGLAVDALPLPFVGGFLAWGVASHALGAIQDIEYDRAAGIGSIATAIGARATAWVSLAGYTIAVLVALAYGGLAVVAALALATYLLLPLAVLSRPTEAQARRAWRSFLGLCLLVGFVLTQLLLFDWGVTTRPPGEIAGIAAMAAVAICLGQLAATTFLLRRARHAARRRVGPGAHLPSDADPDGRPVTSTATGDGRPAPGPPGVDRLPRLSVIVPCRDEAGRLPDTLRALAGQDHPAVEIIVVDDGSTDGSAGVARTVLTGLGRDPGGPEDLIGPRPAGAGPIRDRVIAAPAPPPGWTGKSWACHVGAEAASGRHLLFVDADTAAAPDALSTLHRVALATGAGLVSGPTSYAMPSGPERRWVPGFPMTIRGLVPVWLSALLGGRWRAAAFAYGPLMLVDAATYRRRGGHAATPGSEREDLDLARTMADGPGSEVVLDAADLAATRHYPDGGGALRAWRRVALAYGGDSFAVVLALVAFEVLAWVVPLVLPVLGWAAGDAVMLRDGAVSLAMLGLFRLGAAVAGREPLTSVLWHPITVGGTIAAQLASLVDGVRGVSPIWRGRAYERRT